MNIQICIQRTLDIGIPIHLHNDCEAILKLELISCELNNNFKRICLIFKCDNALFII